MLSDNSKIIEMFETEIWLYLDNQLDVARKQFWDEQIKSSPELQLMLEETNAVLSVYNSQKLHDIEDPSFEKMLSKTANKHSHFSIKDKIKNWLSLDEDRVFNIPKLAFASTLTIAALVLLLFSEKPNPVKNISSEILDWDAGAITEQINDIETGITLIEKDNYKRYIILKMSDDEWNEKIYSISKDIEKLKNEITEVSM